LKHASFFLVLAAALTCSGGALADGAEAERLFREGVRLRDAGDFNAACPKFADSFAADPAPGTLVNLGDCEARIGKLVAANEHYKLAVAGFPKGDKRRELVAQKAAAIEPRIAHLAIKLLSSVPESARVMRGGSPFDRKENGVPVAVDPGTLSVVVSASERKDAVYDVTLAEGQTQELQVDVGAPLDAKVVVVVPPPSEKKGAVPASGTPTLRTAGYVVGGVGVMSVGVGVVTGILAAGKASTVKEHCNTTTYACDSDGVDAAKAGNVLAPVSTITLIAGGILAAGGITMVVLSGKKKEPQVSFVPALSPGGGGASLVGTF
jgi:hypothetical protein